MKLKLMLGLAILIVGLIAQGAFAAELDSSLAFGSLSENMEGYSLNFEAQDIKIGNILTKQLIFLNNEQDSGFFYLKNNNIRNFPEQFDFIFPRINNIKYQLVHYELLSGIFTEEELSSLGIEDQGFFSLITDSGSKSIKINDNLVNALILPDNGTMLIIITDENFESFELPVDLKFEEGSSASENLEDVASGEAEIQSGETGCIDHDDVSSNAELQNINLEQNSPSFVTYISQKNNGDLISTTIPDFCAESTNEQGEPLSKLYEAECSADGLPIYKEVDCDCKNGACKVPNEETQKFCVDTDPLVYDESLNDENKIITPLQGFTNTFNVKGTTVGNYAAENGKEFGVWEDYCADKQTLVEYYCTNDETTMFRTITCPMGCSNSKCEEQPYCFETDGGKAVEYTGTTKSIDQRGNYHNSVDKCNENILTEYYCNASNIVEGMNSEDIPCGEGKECQDGRCINTVVCSTDDDCTSGKKCRNEVCVEGCTTIDDCSPSQTCISGICEDRECSTDNDCASGQTCIDGACADSQATSCMVQGCPAGYQCNIQTEQCEAIPKKQKCSSCLNERPYDVLVWNGETCEKNENNKEELQVLSCHKGTYCVENEKFGTQCVLEPTNTWPKISEAFSRLKTWAQWLNEFIPDSNGNSWASGLGSVATGINSIDESINSASNFSAAPQNNNLNPQGSGLTEGKRAEGAFCTSNDQCASGNCIEIGIEGEKICRPAEDVSPTQKIGEACNGETQICIENGECQNNVCVCTSIGDSNACPYNKYCSTIGNSCVDKKSDGHLCTNNYECLLGQCSNNGICLIEGSPDNNNNVGSGPNVHLPF